MPSSKPDNARQLDTHLCQFYSLQYSLQYSLHKGLHMLCMPSLFQMGLEVTGPWLMQLLLVAKPPHGVVGVAAVRLDEVWRCHSCRAGLTRKRHIICEWKEHSVDDFYWFWCLWIKILKMSCMQWERSYTWRGFFVPCPVGLVAVCPANWTNTEWLAQFYSCTPWKLKGQNYLG